MSVNSTGEPMTNLPYGETFQTANGSLTFSEFGELVSRVWSKAMPDTPMYPAGTPSDQMPLPNITWACGGRKRMGSIKDMVIDELQAYENRVLTKRF